MKQPYSTLSNLAYLLVGVVAMSHSLDAFSVAFAASCAILAIGSGWYHWTLSKTGQYADESAMYLVLVVLLFSGLHAHYTLHPILAVIPFVAWFVSLFFLDLLDSHIVVPTLAVLLVTVVGFLSSWIGAGILLASLALCAVIRHYGEVSDSFRTHEIAHSLWHVGTAILLAYGSHLLTN